MVSECSKLGVQPELIIGKTVFAEDDLVPHQKEALVHVMHLIERILKDNKNKKTESLGFIFEKSTHVVSIFGNRGDGKTATLVSIIQTLLRTKKEDVLVAPILEPELLRTNKEEELFLSIAFNLYRLLEEKEKTATPNKLCPTSEFITLKQDLHELVKDFLARSSGANLMAELSGSMEGLTERFMHHGASILSSAQRFRGWIDNLLKTTKCELLVFPVDDLDLCKDMGPNVLEAIRIYLSHPRVVVIITANLRTLRRSVLNANLQQLPNFFVGNDFNLQKQCNDCTNDEFHKIIRCSRTQLLASEYQKEVEHAKQFLYKIIPPAYRFYMYGLNADERQSIKFSLFDTNLKDCNVSLKMLLRKIILLKDVVDHQEEKKHTDIGKTINELLEQTDENAQRHVEGIVKNYFKVTHISVRVLLNQVYKFYQLVYEWRAALKSITQESSGGSDTMNSNEQIDIPVWALKLAGIDHNSKDKVIKIIRLEEKYFMRILDALKIHPDIQVDMNLFFSNDEQTNAFKARTLSEFWNLIKNINYTVSSYNQYWFQYTSRDGNRLSDASSALLNVTMEYWALKVNPAFVLKNFKFEIDENPGFEIKQIALLEYIKQYKFEKISLNDSIFANLKLMDILDPGNDKKMYIVHFKPFYSSILSAFASIQETLRYIFNVQDSLSHRNLKERIHSISKHHEMISNYNRRSSDPKQPILGVTVLDLNRNFFNVCCLFVYNELEGLSNAFLKGTEHLSSMIQNKSTDQWKIIKVNKLREHLVALLNLDKLHAYEGLQEDDRKKRRLLILLYLANLPLAPLLTVWYNDSKKGDLKQLIIAVYNVLEANKKEGCNFEKNFDFKKEESQGEEESQDSIILTPGKPAISYDECIIESMIGKNEQSNQEMRDMLKNVSGFFGLLVNLYNYTPNIPPKSDSKGPQTIDYEGLPTIWQEFFDTIPDPNSTKTDQPTSQPTNQQTKQNNNGQPSNEHSCRYVLPCCCRQFINKFKLGRWKR